MGSLFAKSSKIQPENHYKNSGQKKPKHPRKKRLSLYDLPTSLEELVALYQKHDILPTHKDGYLLELVGPEIAKSRGDKINDGFKFKMVGKTTHPQYYSIRPKLLENSKFHMLVDFWRLYDIAMDTPHNIIAEKHGLVHDVFPASGKPYRDVNYSPITRLRSSVFQLVTAHAEDLYFQIPRNRLGGPTKIIALDATVIGQGSKNGVVI